MGYFVLNKENIFVCFPLSLFSLLFNSFKKHFVTKGLNASPKIGNMPKIKLWFPLFDGFLSSRIEPCDFNYVKYVAMFRVGKKQKSIAER